uniref:Uncharacterized protein n=1 Tax=Avena sativa TaxID=4498 RepID=A0ACD5U163_AVESA
MRAYRRARGLCYTCGEKWARDHTCGPTVPLHVVEELMALLASETDPDSSLDDQPAELCVISEAALQGVEPPHTVRLKGTVADREVLMLVDPGSTHSFISEAIAAAWPTVRRCRPMQVKVVDGGVLRCDLEVPDCAWQAQGVDFSTTLRLFPLGCYEIILGMDWLESIGSMKVHWGRKQLAFEHHGHAVQLQGLVANTTTCPEITANQLEALDKMDSICHLVQLREVKEPYEQNDCPLSITQLLSEFDSIFDEPKGLPPPREFDHVITLLPGSRPVNLRPYRYNPEQKDEIERQIADMLKQGTIRFSTSPFASPVLLVQKKDGTWRFCIDFRYLNALTLKNRYPLPVIDELLDELAGASWFTSLDLRAGYHQIRMAPGEEHKTTFQTHQVHYEFMVMQYGLTDTSVPVVTDLHDWLQERQLVTALLRQHLHRANTRMKHFADRKRSDRSFQVGDWVYLRLQPYVQTSLAMRANAKLAFRFFGPFQVEQKVGDLSYRLKLPETSKLHPVFHVSQLRGGAPPTVVHPELPAMDDAAPHHHVPLRVLETRQVRRRKNALEQARIQWSGLPASMATWENLLDLKTRFPRAPAWGQATAKGRGNVMGPRAHVPEEGPGQRPRRNRRENGRNPAAAWTR